jgi:hypothetical protein
MPFEITCNILDGDRAGKLKQERPAGLKDGHPSINSGQAWLNSTCGTVSTERIGERVEFSNPF